MGRINHKHLSRDEFEFLLDTMMEHEPDHPVTEWLKRAWCINDCDSNIRTGSELGYKMMQYHLTEFDEEDDDFYEQYWGDDEEEELEWDE
jgi:hypothetical protein|tara:strand:- start:2754 stop:3023 length:270 start_codon:yes stop_codon:yes gene_type:complete